MTISQVWTEKYRPQTIEDVVMEEPLKEFFRQLTCIPNNLLFIGPPGVGKTTVAKILAKKFAPNSYLYINASEHGNIDTVRTTISDFVAVGSFDGNDKIVILNEADGVSLIAQQALRSVMEDYLSTVRFILTANYKNKIIEAIHSRCQEFTFACPLPLINARVGYILKAEKIKFEPGEMEKNRHAIRHLLRSFSPDLRKIINELQRWCLTGTFHAIEGINTKIADEIIDDLKTKTEIFTIRQKVLDNTPRFENDYHFLMKEMFHLAILNKNVGACILIADHMVKHHQVMDVEINFSSLLFQLSEQFSTQL